VQVSTSARWREERLQNPDGVELLRTRKQGWTSPMTLSTYCGSTLAIALFPPASYSRGCTGSGGHPRDSFERRRSALQTYLPSGLLGRKRWTYNFVDVLCLRTSTSGFPQSRLHRQSSFPREEWKVDVWRRCAVSCGRNGRTSRCSSRMCGELYGQLEQPSFDA